MTGIDFAIVWRSKIQVVAQWGHVHEREYSGVVYRTAAEAEEATRQRLAAIERLPGWRPRKAFGERPLPVIVALLPEGLVNGDGEPVPSGTMQVVSLGDVVRFATGAEAGPCP